MSVILVVMLACVQTGDTREERFLQELEAIASPADCPFAARVKHIIQGVRKNYYYVDGVVTIDGEQFTEKQLVRFSFTDGLLEILRLRRPPDLLRSPQREYEDKIVNLVIEELKRQLKK